MTAWSGFWIDWYRCVPRHGPSTPEILSHYGRYKNTRPRHHEPEAESCQIILGALPIGKVEDESGAAIPGGLPRGTRHPDRTGRTGWLIKLVAARGADHEWTLHSRARTLSRSAWCSSQRQGWEPSGRGILRRLRRGAWGPRRCRARRQHAR